MKWKKNKSDKLLTNFVLQSNFGGAKEIPSLQYSAGSSNKYWDTWASPSWISCSPRKWYITATQSGSIYHIPTELKCLDTISLVRTLFIREIRLFNQQTLWINQDAFLWLLWFPVSNLYWLLQPVLQLCYCCALPLKITFDLFL